MSAPKPLFPRPSWLLDIPERAYHAESDNQTYLSSHWLAEFRNSPAVYKAKRDGLIPRSESSAFAFGSAAHCFILEGSEAFAARYCVTDGPVNPKTGKPFGTETKAYAEWAAEQAKPAVSNEEFARILGMKESLKSHVAWGDLFAIGTPEGTIPLGIAEGVVRGCVHGRWCQARIDWIVPQKDMHNPTRIVDLKTCQNLDDFERDAKRYGYAHQLSFYRNVLNHNTLDQDLACADVYLVAVEKSVPYRVGVWHVSAGLLNDCQTENAKAIQELQKCEYAKKWPTRYEDYREFAGF